VQDHSDILGQLDDVVLISQFAGRREPPKWWQEKKAFSQRQLKTFIEAETTAGRIQKLFCHVEHTYRESSQSLMFAGS
jgi:predicted RNA-binding protein